MTLFTTFYKHFITDTSSPIICFLPSVKSVGRIDAYANDFIIKTRATLSQCCKYFAQISCIHDQKSTEAA